ncbi:sensor histidine kinase [Pseudonocardia sp. H11422]|uniref:sensor histidine kinase n=1 Tax=Pseudonocardia sp. H11422 TaxID=2835866 RepID=UPI001BDCEE1D|nr:histidine kinase [Pseudonocardia sp. H11422]
MLPQPQRISGLSRRLGLVAELLAYGFWLFFDTAMTLSGPVLGVLTPLAGATVAALVLLRHRRGVDPLRLAAVVFGSSIAMTAASAFMGLPAMSLTEQLALAIMMITALRPASQRTAIAIAFASAAAIVGSAYLRGDVSSGDSGLMPMSALGWGGALAIGLTIREADTRRRTQLADARTAERMELARELHDVVAHHVTGIVVAAQAAGVVARRSPDEVDRALAAIEHAGTDALAAMRRMVGVLRGQEGTDTSEGARTPGADLNAIPALVERFDPERSLVRLRTDPGFAHTLLPAGVAATGYRVVQEALTNVRRHATEATAVEVEIRIREGALLVSVRNDGVRSGPPSTPLGGAGGFGLAGMAERVAALDGTLTAGPTGPGVWTVAARLPLGARA